MALQGCKVIVHGHVQMVGFRYATAKLADELGLTGSATNLSDGDVEIKAFGDKKALDDLVFWLRSGPERAQVNALVITAIDYAEHSQFTCG